jgi:hypothetical protein
LSDLWNAAGQPLPALPANWTMRQEPDGLFRLSHQNPVLMVFGMVFLAFSLMWEGMAFLMMVVSVMNNVLMGLFMIPFMLFGLIFVAIGAWLAFGRTEWRIGANQMQAHFKLLGYRRVTDVSGGILRIRHFSSRRGYHWSLQVDDAQGKNRQVFFDRKREAVERLAEIISRITGWPVGA